MAEATIQSVLTRLKAQHEQVFVSIGGESLTGTLVQVGTDHIVLYVKPEGEQELMAERWIPNEAIKYFAVAKKKT